MEVTASTLYEAVALHGGQAQGLAAIRGHEWVAGVSEGRAVKVSVADVRVEHEVKLGDFTRWLETKGRSPACCRQAEGGDSAAKDTGDIGDGRGEIGEDGV